MSWRVGFQKVFAVFTSSSHTFSIESCSWFVKMPFYAVANGRTTGIYMTWTDCEAQVKGYSGARYKKFDTVVDAQDFIQTVGDSQSNAKTKPIQSGSRPANNLKKPFFSSSVTVDDIHSTTKTNPAHPSGSGPAKNLKRSLSTSSYVQKSSNSNQTFKNKPRDPSHSDESETFTDDDDDLNTILCKQLDDVEKRLKGFGRDVDKIIKKTQISGRKAIMIGPSEPKKMRVSGKQDFDVDHDGFVQVYTDGACSANGRKGARAGLGVYWSEGHPLNVSEPVSGRATNNCGEIQAATKAIKLALENGVQKLTINTDSQFLINSVTKWMPGWKKKGWKLKSGEVVKNEKDFRDLDSVQNKLEVKWKYVEAHRGVHGNEMADQLAKAGAAHYTID